MGEDEDYEIDWPDWATAGSADNPPDCWIAVGDGEFGVVVNHHVAFYSTVSLDLVDQVGLDAFFAIGGHPYDPRIVWDHHLDRFVAVTLGSGSLQFGWSAPGEVSPLGVAGVGTSVWDSEPLDLITTFDYSGCGQGTLYALTIDRPSLGFDHRAWYVSTPTAEHLPQGADAINNFFYIVRKPPYSTFPFEVVRVGSEAFRSSYNSQLSLGCFQKDGIPGRQGREGAFACVHRGDEEPPAAYFVGIATERRDGQQVGGFPCAATNENLLRLYAISDPLDTMPVGNPDGDRELWFYDLGVPCFDPAAVSVPDSGPDPFDAGDGRITAAEWRSVDGEEFLYACHMVVRSIPVESQIYAALPQAVVRWYVIRTNGWPDSGQAPTLFDWGTIDGGVVDVGGQEVEERPVHLCYPALATNEFGDIAFVMAKTSEGEKLSIQATGRLVTYPAHQTAALKFIRDSDHEGPIAEDEFGDYFGIAPVPDGGNATFWLFGGYVSDVYDQKSNPGYRWKTYAREIGIQ